MYRKDNHFYIAYGYDGEEPRDEMEFVPNGKCDIVRNDFTDYKTALKYAKISHKEEIEYQREENGRKDGCELLNTYVMKIEKGYNDYEVAMISGWRSKVTEYEWE